MNQDINDDVNIGDINFVADNLATKLKKMNFRMNKRFLLLIQNVVGVETLNLRIPFCNVITIIIDNDNEDQRNKKLQQHK